MHQLCVMHSAILCASPQCHSAQHIAPRYMPSRKPTLRMALSRKGRGCEDKYIIARYAAHKVSSLRLRRSSPQFCRVHAHNVTLHNTSLCIKYPRVGFTVRVLSYYRYLEEIEKNILQRCIFICRLKKMLYLCTRNQEITSECKGSGALVQLVRIRACHARGQGFESPTHRTKEDNRMVVFFFCIYTSARAKLIASTMCYAQCHFVCKPTMSLCITHRSAIYALEKTNVPI